MSVYEDADGVLWAGRREGLSRMTDREGRFENFPADPDGSGMPGLIIAIVEDLAGTLWLGSLRDGLARFDPVTGKIETFRHDVRDTTSLSDDF